MEHQVAGPSSSVGTTGNIFFQYLKPKGSIAAYSYDFKEVVTPDIVASTNLIRKHLFSYVNPIVRQEKSIKIRLTFYLLLERSSDNLFIIKKYPSKSYACDRINPFTSTLSQCSQFVNQLIQLTTYSKKSGFVILAVSSIKVHIIKYEAEKVNGYLPPPQFLRGKRGYLSVEEDGNKCLLYSLLIGFHMNGINTGNNTSSSLDKNTGKIIKKLNKPEIWSSLVQNHDLKLTELNFNENKYIFDMLEQENNFSVSIFTYSKRARGIVPYRLTKRMAQKHVTLLRIRQSDLSSRE